MKKLHISVIAVFACFVACFALAINNTADNSEILGSSTPVELSVNPQASIAPVYAATPAVATAVAATVGAAASAVNAVVNVARFFRGGKAASYQINDTGVMMFHLDE